MIVVGYSKRISDLIVKEPVPIKEQNDRIREFAKNEGYVIERFYIDKSDDPDSDEGFQKLRIDGMNRRFDLVILDSIFRCGKNFKYARNLLYMTFYKVGIDFAVLEDGVNTVSMTDDEVERYFVASHSRFLEAREYSQRREKYKKEKTIPLCRDRYGYIFNEAKTDIQIDDEAAEVIRLIFEMASAGVKKVKIASELNRIGVETPSVHMSRVGRRTVIPGRSDWISEAVGRILATDIYMGDDSNLQTEGVVYPRIIDPETFWKAQELIKHKHIKRYRNHYLLKRWIYFRDTDEKLCYREKESAGKVLAYYHRAQDDVRLAYYEDILKELRIAFERERRLVLSLCKMNPDDKLYYVSLIDDSFRDKAKELFYLSLDAQRGNVDLYARYDNGEITQDEYDADHEAIMSRQRVVNDMFHELMEERKKRIIYLGKDNPWVKRFLKYDPERELNCNTVNALVRRVEIYPDRRIVVHLNTEGKEYVPEGLLKEAEAYGQKE